MADRQASKTIKNLRSYTTVTWKAASTPWRKTPTHF